LFYYTSTPGNPSLNSILRLSKRVAPKSKIITKQFFKVSRKAIALKPDYAEAYNNRGNDRSNPEDYQEAIADYQKAAELYQEQGNTEWYQKAINKINELEQ
jgi:tetratricopeptide (TPR) repeat protein